MPEGVGAAVEKREVSASFHELRGSVKKKKKKKSAKQQDSSCLQAGGCGAGWTQLCLLPHTRSSQAEAGGWLWLLVTLQILGPLSTLVVHLAELLDATAGLQDHLLRYSDHHTEEIWVLKALK